MVSNIKMVTFLSSPKKHCQFIKIRNTPWLLVLVAGPCLAFEIEPCLPLRCHFHHHALLHLNSKSSLPASKIFSFWACTAHLLLPTSLLFSCWFSSYSKPQSTKWAVWIWSQCHFTLTFSPENISQLHFFGANKIRPHFLFLKS